MTATDRALHSYRSVRDEHGKDSATALGIATQVIACEAWIGDAELGAAVRALTKAKAEDDAADWARTEALVAELRVKRGAA